LKKWDLPKGWEWKQLGEVGTLISGVTFDARESIDDPSIGYIPILRATNIQSSIILNDFIYVPHDRVGSNQLLSIGDILIAMSSGSKSIVGKAAQLEEQFNGSFGAFCGVFRPYKGINSKYVGYFFNSKFYRNNVRKLSRGANINNLRKDAIRDICLPIPPLETQQRIVAILDIAEEIKRLRAEANAQTQKLIQSVFLDMFGDPFKNPNGWRVVHLREVISSVRNGLSRRPISNDDNQGQIVLRVRDIQADTIDYSDNRRFLLTESEKNDNELVDGDLVFIRVNGNKDYVGRCATFQGFYESVYHSDHIFRIRFKSSSFNPLYLSYLLNTSYGRRQLNDNVRTSAGQYTINQTGLGDTQILCPPIKKQDEFVTLLEFIKMQNTLQKGTLNSLSNLSKSLIDKAFLGELIV